tara:strand:+ start:494 stop:766 length:273 start_codon:yes stop_codon:yes gene_type:complete
MKLTKIYDGRTVSEVEEGRKFFIRAEFTENGHNYVGFKEGDKHRFSRLVIHQNVYKKHYVVRRNSRLEKGMLNLIEENENKIKAGGCVKF